MPDTLFQSSNINLRRFIIDDAAFIFDLLNTPTWKQFIGDRNINTHQDAVNYIINGPQGLYNKYGYGPWQVSLNGTNEPIGMCGLFKRDYLDKPDLGFAFLPGFAGRGLAYEAATASIKYIKDNYDIDKLYASTTDTNTRSQRLLERCGFIRSGLVTPPGEETLLLYALTLQ
ncbi:MAG: GNAT family N-acetyltransferase [Bacteroidota bacterium]